MKKQIVVIVLLVLTLLLLWHSENWSADRGLNVYVIAPSISTSMEARTIRQRNAWSETTNARTADAILVVVRSSLFNPLNNGYDSLGELKRDAENQLNISGPKFHIYLFQFQNDLSVSQMKHMRYEVKM